MNDEDFINFEENLQNEIDNRNGINIKKSKSLSQYWMRFGIKEKIFKKLKTKFVFIPVITIMIIIFSITYLLNNSKSDFFICSDNDDTIYVNINNKLIRIPYPKGFTEIKQSRFIDIKYRDIQKVGILDNDKYDTSDFEIMNLKRGDIYCCIRFPYDEQYSTLEKSSYSTFSYYKDGTKKLMENNFLSPYKTEKNWLIYENNDIMAYGISYDFGIVKKDKIYESTILLFIDGFVIEVIFICRVNDAVAKNILGDYYSIIEEYINRFNDIDIKDNKDDVLDIKDNIESIRK